MPADQFRSAIAPVCVRSAISSAVCSQIAHVLVLDCGWNALVALYEARKFTPGLGRAEIGAEFPGCLVGVPGTTVYAAPGVRPKIINDGPDELKMP